MSVTPLCRSVAGMLLVLAATVAAAAAQEPAAEQTPLRIGRITLQRGDIFSPEEVAAVESPERLLRQVMNGLHVNTREHVLRRELLFAEGDPYDPDALAETERNLRRLGFLNNVRVVAVDTLDDGTVDVVVSARESWTLQANFSFSIASGGDSRWNASLSERNFLGYGTTVGAGTGADELRSYWNLWFRQRRLFGGEVGLGVDYAERDDGFLKNVYLHRDFHAQNDPWQGLAQVYDSMANFRWYLSNGGPSGTDPGRNESLFTELPVREKGGELSALVRVNDRDADRMWRLGAGVQIKDTVHHLGAWSLLSDGRVVDLTYLQEDDGVMAREDGRRNWPFLALQTVGRHWTRTRFVLQYGPDEDILLAPTLDLRLGPAGGQVGSTTGFGAETWRGEGVFGNWWQRGRSLVLLQASGYVQTGGPEVRQHRALLLAGWTAQAGALNTPWLFRVFGEAGQGANLAGTSAFRLGLDRGLRTLDFDGMAGDRLARWNVEGGKASPWEVLGLFRMGGAAFYNGGRAWWHDEEPGLGLARHEVGCGLRFGPIRSANTNIARLDVTWALDGSQGPVFTAISRGYF